MTMTKHDLEFEAPIIGPKVYIIKGPSGWVETFKRKELDAELSRFLTPIPIAELVGMFITNRELGDRRSPVNWFTIVGYLARIMTCSPRAVPQHCAIAFWGQIVIALDANLETN